METSNTQAQEKEKVFLVYAGISLRADNTISHQYYEFYSITANDGQASAQHLFPSVRLSKAYTKAVGGILEAEKSGDTYYFNKKYNPILEVWKNQTERMGWQESNRAKQMFLDGEKRLKKEKEEDLLQIQLAPITKLLHTVHPMEKKYILARIIKILHS